MSEKPSVNGVNGTAHVNGKQANGKQANGKPDRGTVEINHEECKGCGLCVEACPPKVLHLSRHLNRYGYHYTEYLGSGCTGCGICYFACPEPGGVTVSRRDVVPVALAVAAGVPEIVQSGSQRSGETA
jgi:2-oxoglutarate ferredoxin oxidoreductase subunit delta